jgi:hypothetical protein
MTTQIILTIIIILAATAIGLSYYLIIKRKEQ